MAPSRPRSRELHPEQCLSHDPGGPRPTRGACTAVPVRPSRRGVRDRRDVPAPEPSGWARRPRGRTASVEPAPAFGLGAAGGCDRRAPVRERLEHRIAEPLVLRRRDRQEGVLVQPAELGVVDPSEPQQSAVRTRGGSGSARRGRRPSSPPCRRARRTGPGGPHAVGRRRPARPVGSYAARASPRRGRIDRPPPEARRAPPRWTRRRSRSRRRAERRRRPVPHPPRRGRGRPRRPAGPRAVHSELQRNRLLQRRCTSNQASNTAMWRGSNHSGCDTGITSCTNTTLATPSECRRGTDSGRGSGSCQEPSRSRKIEPRRGVPIASAAFSGWYIFPAPPPDLAERHPGPGSAMRRSPTTRTTGDRGQEAISGSPRVRRADGRGGAGPRRA